MSKLSDLPLTAQIRFIQDAWNRERAMRIKVLKGDNQRRKLDECDQVDECLANIEKHLRSEDFRHWTTTEVSVP